VIKVFPVRVGATKVPYGQFYGGLAGWRGARALYRYATDKSHFIVVPIHAYLIDHPRDGLILVDAGISRRQAHEHGDYYRGLAHYLFDDDEYLLDPAEELPAALERLGYRASDVHRVVATHLHEDHVGGLADLPEAAELIVSRREWDERGWRLFGFVPMVYQPTLRAARWVRSIDYTSGPFHNFFVSHALTSDGAVRLLPTPGHTPGHLCVLIRQQGYHLLITGDCLYTLRHLAVDDVQAFGAGGWADKQYASIRRIAELKRRLPDLVLVPGHQNQFEHLVPGLAKGYLTEAERAGIRRYEDATFTDRGRLRPEVMPRYVPGSGPDRVGTVSP
jgi:glyoxylase-like metal-dependent hydrolase (beta-lactamase superfamily II)